MKLRHLVGLFFTSAVTLCLEVSLTRFFSISQRYHFAFLVVSIAFLGYGAAGSFLSVAKKIRLKKRENFLASAALFFSISILLGFLLCNAVPFDLIKVSWSRTHLLYLFLYYIILSVPFFFSGIIISFAIAKSPGMVGTIYFFDLLGAGTGSLFAVFIFLPEGDKGVFLILSSAALIGALLFCPPKSRKIKFPVLLLLAAEAILLVGSPSWLAFRISEFKALPVSLRYPQARDLGTRWNAISRVDIIDSPAVRFAPGLSLLYGQNLPPQMGLCIDGDELHAVTRVESIKSSSLGFLSFLPSSLPYFLLEKPRVLLLEPKGGLDLLAAHYFEASSIKVIEKNPLLPEIMEEELPLFSGDIYRKKNVRVTISTSRLGLKREKERYDLIVFSLPDVLGAAGTGLFGFGENYLYTEEAFRESINRLDDEGMISMTLYLIPPPRQEIRILATWIEALGRMTDHPELHLVALRTWGTISYFVKKNPFGAEEIDRLKEFAARCLFDLVHYPGIEAQETNLHNRFKEPLYYNMTQKLLSPPDRKKFFEDYLFHIEPVSDNRPFFSNFFKLSKIKATFETLGQKWLPLFQGGYLVLLILIQAVLAAALFILGPVFFNKKNRPKKKVNLRKVFGYFGLIGMCFMFVEIALIQKFILFLGYPLYSISFIIFALLVSSGSGSLASKKILGHSPKKNLKWPLWMAAALIFAYSWVWPLFFESFVSLALLPKLLGVFFCLFPLGFLMGFPFPTGIRLVEKTEEEIIPWAWAVNAFSSVVTPILALMLAFWRGYSLVLLLAAGGYIVAPLLLGFADHGNEPHA
jgi:hypothetical protein